MSRRYSRFNEQTFRSSVNKAMENVEQILQVHRKPQLAADVDHEYDNKYELADLLTNMEIIAQMNSLKQLGLTSEILKSIDKSKPNTLRFQASESCTFLKEQTVEVPFAKKETTETTTSSNSNSFFGNTQKSTIQELVRKVQEFHWTVDTHWELCIFPGTNVEKKIVLQSRDSSMLVVTQSKDRPPIEKHTEHQPIDLSLTWLLQQIDTEKLTTMFHIDTDKAKTPRRNEQVDKAINFFDDMKQWATRVRDHFTSHLQRDIVEKHNPVKAEPSSNISLTKSCSALGIFMPIIPLMEDQDDVGVNDENKSSGVEPTEAKSSLALPPVPAGDDNKSRGPTLSGEDCIKFLNEHIRSIEEKVSSLQKAFPSAHLVKLFSVAEATMAVLCEHTLYLSQQYGESMHYIEKMLEDQLVKAIGKRVSTEDLEQFVRFHNAKFLNPPPKPFCHAIGRPNHYPFGVLSIESANKAEPIETMMREVHFPPSSPYLKVPLNAATTLELTGKTYLHGWMNHRCQSSGKTAYQLVARARQFSSFLLVIGTMLGPDQLQPKDAIILQNKDEVIIPLLLNELPSAKEFKDAIQSLSPEQRQFAESFRSMQLESSVFGVCVIQIKPQLEALLGLPEDSLAKEIKLTEDLMELFIEHQVPSDLLSFDDDAGMSATAREKVDTVKGHVQAVLDVIDATKVKQLEESTMRADMAKEMAKAEAEHHLPQPKLAMACAAPAPMMSRAARSRRSAAPAGMMSRSARPQMAMSRSLVSSSLALAPEAMGMMNSAADPNAPSLLRSQNVTKAAPERPPVESGENISTGDVPSDVTDFTAMPKMLDASIEKHDKDSALRSTVIKAGERWSRSRKENLLTTAIKSALNAPDVKSEKNKAFDLLDAISRSGNLPIAYSDLHVLLCVTHCFEKDVMSTVVQDNINPIERLEVSTLLLGSTIFGVPAQELIVDDSDKGRLEVNFPALLG